MFKGNHYHKNHVQLRLILSQSYYLNTNFLPGWSTFGSKFAVALWKNLLKSNRIPSCFVSMNIFLKLRLCIMPSIKVCNAKHAIRWHNLVCCIDKLQLMGSVLIIITGNKCNVKIVVLQRKILINSSQSYYILVTEPLTVK